MNFINLIVQFILLQSYYISTILTCTNITSMRGLTMSCPESNIEIEFKKEVIINCIVGNTNLSEINVYVGEVATFKSTHCNLLNQLGDIFEKWNINNVSWLDISHSCDKDCILTRQQFKNIDFSAIIGISIKDSNITLIEPDVFNNITNLEILILTSNKIRQLPDIFKYAKNLKTLDVGLNEMDTLPETLVAPSLNVFNLYNNKLRHLSRLLFTNMTKLTQLDISNNEIQNLEEDLFHDLTDLMMVSLGRNNFKYIPSKLFSMSKRLIEIRLHSLNLTNISSDTFAGLTDLKTLRLDNNFLDNLPLNIFDDLINLRKLILSHNRITQWRSEYTKQLGSLIDLDLSSNRLTRIVWDLFVNLKPLRALYLNHNMISEMEENIGGPLVDVLDLSHNNLTEVNNIPNVNRLLNLQFNFINHMPFSIIFNSANIDLSYNNISKVEGLDIHLGNKINLRHNNIQYVSLVNVSNSTSKERRIIDLSDNPIKCDSCKTYDLVRYFDSTNNDIPRNGYSLEGNIECASPISKKGENIKNIKAANFTCTDDMLFDCPDKCNCYYHPMSRAWNINCSSCGLEVPPRIFMPTNFDTIPMSIAERYAIKISVDLRNNSLINFTKERDSSYVNVTKLYLSHNKIEVVNWLPPNLTEIALNDNKLDYLHDRTIFGLQDSTTLKHLTLHDNPWDCGCRSKHLIKLIEVKYVIINDDHKLLCSDGRKIVSLHSEGVCGNSIFFLSLFVTIIVLLVIIIIILKKISRRKERQLALLLANY